MAETLAFVRRQLGTEPVDRAMNVHEKINYVEYPASDLVATKSFFKKAFGWKFTDYGPEGAKESRTPKAFRRRWVCAG